MKGFEIFSCWGCLLGFGVEKMAAVSCPWRIPNTHHHFPSPNKPTIICFHFQSEIRHRLLSVSASGHRASQPHLKLKHAVVGFAASASAATLFLAFGLSICSAASSPFHLHERPRPPIQESESGGVEEGESRIDVEEYLQGNEEMRRAFEDWKSKPYALSVPLKIVALQGSVPPSWAKEFFMSQGKRMKFQIDFRRTLEQIFSELSMPFQENCNSNNDNVKASSAVAADLVSIGDSWLSFAIQKGVIEPITDAEEQDWYKGLSPQWKTYLRRNRKGEIDPEGEIWAAPYRWGSMVIAYKRSQFQKHGMAPIEDWADLWRPELAGKISMVNSPREVVGAVLKYMGASYNTVDIDSQISGGKKVVQKNLVSLLNQVRLFDSMNYLKAFTVGDVWVAVGCSSDVLPTAKRTTSVSVVVPKSGANLWADLWVIPAASRLETTQIGGRVRGPSPLIHQWIEFCLQATRARPFQLGVVAGSSPSSLGGAELLVPAEFPEDKALVNKNLSGVPPSETLPKCEFLEPLSEATLSDYRGLIASVQKHDPSVIHLLKHQILSLFGTLWYKLISMKQ